MKLFYQIFILLILLSSIVFFTTLFFTESMGFDKAYNSGILSAYEISYFSGLVLSLLAIPASLIGVISGLIKKKKILFPILLGVTGITYILTLFVMPVIQSLNERDETTLNKKI